MSFRRIPFQFSTTDPAERQRELEKRFGVPSQNKMYVDAANPLTMGSGFNTSTSSPRFQHRVPLFVDGMPVQSSVDSRACENKSPKVRVIPIEIEQDERSPPSRHRTFSGPAEISKHPNKEMCSQKDDVSTLKRSMEDLSKPSKMKSASGPRVYNIPIKVDKSGVKEKKTKLEKEKMPTMKPHSKVNGEMPNHDENVKPEPSPQEKKVELTEEERMKININNSLTKIECVQEELKSYETGVNEFNGTAKDKQYRYLDEMLTRCMIKLDDVETMGNEEVRSARKKVVKMVQACIDLLESKVNTVTNSDIMNTNDETKEIVEKEEQPAVAGEETATKSNVKSNTVDIPEDNQQVTNIDESLMPQSETLTKEGMDDVQSTCESEVDVTNNVPEVEMAGVTSTSCDVNEKTCNDDSVTDPMKSDVLSNEVEMTEVTTQIDLQQQNESSKSEEPSTNVSIHGIESVDPAHQNYLIDANMTDVSSICNNPSEDQKESIHEVSSSILQPEEVGSNLEQIPTEIVMSEDCETTKNIETQKPENNLNGDSKLTLSIPEVEMKDVDENRKNNTSVDNEQFNLQSKCISNNEPK